MPIPKAASNDVFGYYFHHAIFVKKGDACRSFLDRFAFETVREVCPEDGGIWISPEDAMRIYAPYLSARVSGNDADGFTGEAVYAVPDAPERKAVISGDCIRQTDDGILIDLLAVMQCFGKRGFSEKNFAVMEIDPEKQNVGSDNGGMTFDGAPAHPRDLFRGFGARLPYLNILDGKDRGELNYCMWYEPAQRMLPYRMYIPFGFEPGTPHKTIVCFHGGDANCDYMFYHTKGAIEEWAENRNYILLAITSPWKYTFFGGSRFPTGSEPFDPSLDNPLGLTEEEWKHSVIAEQSVMIQIQDAAKRFSLDMDRLYAMGNSGGSLGIFRQVQAIGRPFFRRAACSGGVAAPGGIDYDRINAAGTKFLLVMSSEDAFDGQFTGRVAFPIFRENGMNVELTVVGGGAHLTGWTKALERIFDFFDRL